jgi:hypothetical protein
LRELHGIKRGERVSGGEHTNLDIRVLYPVPIVSLSEKLIKFLAWGKSGIFMWIFTARAMVAMRHAGFSVANATGVGDASGAFG